MTKRKSRITRRKFLQSSVATAALPVIVPRSALGQAQKPPASERITLGFIGMGTQGRGLMGGFLGQKDVQVLAVCDVDSNRRDFARKIVEERYAQQIKSGQYKGCAVYADFRELLRRK